MIAGTGFLFLKNAFVLKESDVSKIWTLIGEHNDIVKATVSCSDKIKRTFSSHKEVIELENPRSREIIGIEFAGNTNNFQQRAVIEVQSSHPPIRLWIEGEEQFVSHTLSALNDLIDGMKPWYSFIARTDLFFVLPPLAALMFIVRFVARYSGPDKPRQEMDLTHALYFSMTIILIMIGVPLLTWLLNMVRARLFPIGAFRIGQGKERFALLEKWQWLAIPGFIVSVIASLLAALLIRR
jgi:hypothetical protein